MTSAVPVSLAEDPRDRLSAMVETHYDRLYRLARRLAGSADEARDLVQETFLKAARSPGSVPAGLTGEERWLVRVLVNIRRDEWRKTAVRRRRQPDVTAAVAAAVDCEAAFIARAIVWQALDALTPRRRAAVVMYELEGLPIPAIASLLGISPITVRWHLSAGRRQLARILRPEIGESK